MSGDYFYEFGKVSKRRSFSRLETNRGEFLVTVNLKKVKTDGPTYIIA